MAIKILKYVYTSNISFIGLLPKSQFIQDVSDLTPENKNAIKERIVVTDNAKDIKLAKEKIGRTIKIVK